MKIIVSGPASASDSSTGEMITDIESLKALDGLRYDKDVCANYLNHELLNSISIVGGSIQIVFDRHRGQLRVISEYWSPAALTPDQIEALVEDTSGQWSDGIGEGCFDEWSTKSGVGLSLAPFLIGGNERLVAEQVEDGRDVPRFSHLAKAVWDGAVEVAEQAVAERADLNAIYDGHTALLLAIRRQNARIALLLINGGAEVNRPSELGTTPLMACTSFEKPEEAIAVATALLAKGADLTAHDWDGNTALDEATRKGRNELAALFSAQSTT